MLSVITVIRNAQLSGLQNIFQALTEARTPFETKFHGREGSVHIQTIVPMGTKRPLSYAVSVEYNQGYGRESTGFAFKVSTFSEAVEHTIRSIQTDCGR